ncbi:MAG: type II toxin-antitoxin system PemK/MazF family toxin, partial [Betaproteobacteria bacterium]|nr:type II toxin-antitoxin system PemK/MazF family toxin [Betaproteobacteria bacterium]
MRRGDIWWAKLPGPWGRRPVLLIARNEAYQLLTWVVAVPLATRLRDAPSMVVARRLRARGVSQ